MADFVPGTIALSPDGEMVNVAVEIEGKRIFAHISGEALADISHEGGMETNELVEAADRFSQRIAEAVERKYLFGTVDSDGWVFISPDDLR